MRIDVLYHNELVGQVAELKGDYFFKYTPSFIEKGIELAPLMMPLKNGAEKIYNFKELYFKTFYGLPGLLADSIPDKFGNTILNAWLNEQGKSINTLNSLERLAYIGNRGMGAMEYQPDSLSNNKLATNKFLSINQLSDIAASILKDNSKTIANINQKDSFHNLFEIGTSAGGARAKALIAIHKENGDIISGQLPVSEDYDAYIVKFDTINEDNKSGEMGLIEMAYYDMARKANIDMMPSKLLEENNRFHFATKRFDRTNSGEKIHVQTLCALGHYNFRDFENNSYESLFYVARTLNVSYKEREQLFRRMIFNVLARNVDDHTKNFAFLMHNNKWKITPAYDIAYNYDPKGLFTQFHKMSINGKHGHFNYSDFEKIAQQNSINKPKEIFEEVKESIAAFPKLAQKYQMSADKIKSINDHLILDI